MYFKIKGEDDIRIDLISDDKDLKKEEAMSLKILEKLTSKGKKIKYAFIRRTLKTSNNLAKECIKDLSVQVPFLLDSKDRFLTECLVGIGTDKVNPKEIKKVYDKFRDVESQITALSNFNIKDIFKGINLSRKSIPTNDEKKFIERMKNAPLNLIKYSRFCSMAEGYLKECKIKTTPNNLDSLIVFSYSRRNDSKLVGDSKKLIRGRMDDLTRMMFNDIEHI